MSIDTKIANWDRHDDAVDYDAIALPSKAGLPRQLTYKAQARPVPVEALEEIASAVKAHVAAYPLDIAEVDAKRPIDFKEFSANVEASVKKVAVSLSLADLSEYDSSVVFCRWVPPHTDAFSRGRAFVSVVAHTGPHPYIMQSVATQLADDKRRTTKLFTKTVGLEVGDILVFDPEEPHYTAPAYPSDESLLVLVQFDLPLGSNQDLMDLYQRFMPRS